MTRVDDGFSAEVARRVQAKITDEVADTGGIGGTLAANVLSLAAMRATLGEVLTDEAFARMIALGERFEAGVRQAIDATGCRGTSPGSAAASSTSSTPSGRAPAPRPRRRGTRRSTS